MKLKMKFLAIVLLMLGAFVLSGCGGGSDDNKATTIDVIFQSAVQTGGTTGTVESTGLTLTFNVDPATLTASNITVTGATKGALSGTGTTRSLAISDINVADGGTVTVAITSPAGYSITGSPKNALVYRLTVANITIGMNYRGGKLAYVLQSGDSGYDANVPHGLIAATADQHTGIVWITGGSTQTSWVNGSGYGGTSTALGTGQANTNAMKNQSGYDGGAAKVCDDYVNTDTGSGVYTNWYLPSQDELNKLYLNRVAIGGFAATYYWSSSENLAGKAWLQHFVNGVQNDVDKDTTFYVRAVRAF